jgi:hypothetical protein
MSADGISVSNVGFPGGGITWRIPEQADTARAARDVEALAGEQALAAAFQLIVAEEAVSDAMV